MIQRVGSQKLASLVRKASAGLHDLEALSGPSRVPSQPLARRSPAVA